LVAAASVLLAIPWTAQGQTESGKLTGLVQDVGGRPLEGVSVSVRSASVGVARSVKTDREGRFSVAHLGPGRYTISAERHGFVGGSAEVQLAIGAVASVRITLVSLEDSSPGAPEGVPWPWSTVAPGTKVRLRTASGRLTGRVLALAHSDVRLDSGGSETRIAYASVLDLEVSRGRRGRTVAGLVIGAAAGVVAGVAAGCGDCVPNYKPRAGAVFGVLGGALGALAGRTFGSESWGPPTASRSGIGVFPAPGGGAAVALRIGF
jgi:hypothetical protein